MKEKEDGIEEVIEEDSFDFKIGLRIIKEPVPRFIKDIFNEYILEDKINLKPEFQRDFVWSISKQKELIKSICSGIPLPMFYFSETEDDKLEVIDGQQRLTTIFGFLKISCIKDITVRKKLLKSINLMDGSKIIEAEQIREIIRKSSIYCVIVPKSNLNAKFEIFQKLNQGSTVLKPQEIRNSIFTEKIPKFNSMLKYFGKEIRKTTMMKLERMGGEELAYRFYVINKYGYGEDADLRKTMNDVETTEKDFNDLVEKKMYATFRNYLKTLQHLFGKRNLDRLFQVLKKDFPQPSDNKFGIHIYSGKINQGLFHLFSYYLPKYNNNQIQRVKSNKFLINYLKLLKNEEFVSIITGSGTNTKKNILKSKAFFENKFLKKTLGEWTNVEIRNISSEAKKTLFKNIPYCYLTYKLLTKEKFVDVTADHIESYDSGSDSKYSNILLALRSENSKKNKNSLEKYRKTKESILLRKENKKNIDLYLKQLKKWNKSFPLDQYDKLIKYAIEDKSL